MAYSTIAKSSSFFNSTIYTGNGTVDTALTTGTFQPDLTWFKNRGTTESNMWMDAVRGATYYIQSNSTAAEGNSSDKISAFTSTGVTLGSGAETNENSQPLVCWAWKANGSGSSNSDGTITSTVSVDSTSKFSIVKWTGNSTAGATVGHGLGVAPSFMIIKNLGAATQWLTWWDFFANTEMMYLNLTNAKGTGQTYLNSTTPTSSVITLGGGADENQNDMIAYCFAEVPGFSKFGTYTGNGVVNGAFAYTGFKPSFVVIKRQDQSTNWVVYDNKRDSYNVGSKVLLPDNSAAETSGSQLIDFLSNGFKLRSTGNNTNDSSPYVYMAFGQPIVSTNGIIATAR